MKAWVCALGILGVSATIVVGQFYYSKGSFRKSNDCNLCYNNECLVLDEARCDYYLHANKMLNKEEEDPPGPDNLPLRKEVDDLIFDLIAKATGLSSSLQCIPYISRYTDCNKENVCLGCRTCFCDSDGNWNCTISQQCHTSDPVLNIDHRVLVMVMESLTDAAGSKKTKRSVTENPKESYANASTKYTLEQMSEWLYGVPPLSSNQNFSSTESKSTHVEDDGTEAPTTISDLELDSRLTTSEIIAGLRNSSDTDTDYVAFDEVLRNIAVDTKSYNRRKPLDNNLNNTTFDIDYMLMDEDNATSENSTDDLAYIVNYMQEYDVTTESTVESATKIVIDLLQTVAQGRSNDNETQDYDIYNKNDDIAFENTNDIIEYNANNIMKRDVSGVTMPDVAPNVTFIVNTTNSTNITEENMDLKNDVLKPLNKIINDKRQELEDLKRIKDNLIKFIKSDDKLPEDNNSWSENNTNNTYFSIYNLAMEPGLEIDLRRATPNGIDKYMYKLKRDIYEVIRDVIGIQKHKTVELPEDLKHLIRAMKRYAYKNKINGNKLYNLKSKQTEYTRRTMEQNFGRCDYISFKDCIVQVIEVIDKDMPKSDALSPLSPVTKKMMKHLIQRHYVDEYSVVGLRAHDPQYNLTNDLKDIGSKWQAMTSKIISSSPFVTLYRMKLLHYVLTMDVSKMNDAMALLDFAHSRRMLYSLDNISENMLERINTGLKEIHNKIQIIIRYYSTKPKSAVSVHPRSQDITTVDPIQTALDTRKKKNRSFIKHIRSLLKSSKKDIAELLHRKVPKSEIVKQLARKKLDEISEKRYNDYEETMRRWQKNLAMAPRIKRSVLDVFKTRIKNIIPNYLRHKVNPKIKEKKQNDTANSIRKADDRKKKRKLKNRERKARRTTTPTTMKSSEYVKPKVTKSTTRAITAAPRRAVATTVKLNVSTKNH